MNKKVVDLDEVEDKKPSRRLSDDDNETVDLDTGEAVFDDTDSKFLLTDEDREQLDGSDEDSDEDSDDEPKKKRKVVDEEDEDEDEEVSDLDESKDEEDPDEEVEKTPANLKFKKRIDRSLRIQNELREENEALNARLARIEAGLRKRTSDEELKVEREKVDAELKTLRTELRAAKEAGDTDKEIEINDRMQDIRVDLKAKELVAADAKQTESEAPAVDRKTRLVSQWKRKHARYNSDAEFKEVANALDRVVARDGFDPHSDEYYKELDKRLAKRFPEEYPRKKPVEKEARRHPSSAPDDRGDTRRPDKKAGTDFRLRNGKVTLSSRQVENMRRFGMDPDDANDVKSYVVNNLPARR